MNLFDIVKRRDRSLIVEAGTIEAVSRGGHNGFMGVRLSAGAVVRLVSANKFACLSTFPRDVGWQILGDNPKLTVTASDQHRADILFEARKNPPDHVLFTWPIWTSGGFDLILTNASDLSLEIASTPRFNPRNVIAPLLVGKGTEVGPGVNPFVKSDSRTQVTYIEAYSAEDWQRMYHKEELTADWSQYILGDAHYLAEFSDGSLDFIFSSHVFEHLMNPIGVLENWSKRLKVGGVIAGVVPDLRYCFDLRQPASTRREWELEYESESWTLSPSKYEKWCKFTAGSANPETLKARKYSIHAHYYTTQSFRSLLDIAIERGWIDRVFLNTSPNNKDFGFVAWK